MNIQKLKIVILIWGFLCSINGQSQDTLIYKNLDQGGLRMVSMHADSLNAVESPVAILLSGGGWTHFSWSQLKPVGNYLTAMGCKVYIVEYRTTKYYPSCTPIDGLIDVKDAISYLREHAPNLGVNPQKILAVGASAGAQLAFASCQNNPITHTTPQPHAPNYIVAFSPVLRNDEKGYGASRVGAENIPWFSTWNLYLTTPHHLPPSIIFSGENDPLIKLKDLELFQEQAVQKGDRIELVPIPNVGHSMKKTIPEIYQITEAQIVTFLNNNHFN